MRRPRRAHCRLVFVSFAFFGICRLNEDIISPRSFFAAAPPHPGLSGKRVRYLSVPYSSVRSFSVASAGKVDADQELVLHCRGLGRVSFDFDSDVDACAVYRFLGASILGVEGAVGYDASALVGDFSSVVGTTMGGGGGGSLPSLLLDVLGSDYGRMDEGEVGSRLRCVLLEDERVEMAFGCGRDTFVLTSHRLLRVNVQGATGTKGECVRALTVVAADGVISTTPVIISASQPLVCSRPSKF